MEKFSNPRGETANLDGGVVWHGDNTDEGTRKFNALQPVESVFPPCAPTAAEARLRSVVKACLLGIAPEVTPADEAEKTLFRSAWDTCVQIKKNYYSVHVLPLVFSVELGVFARDVFVMETMGGLAVFVPVAFATSPTKYHPPFSAFTVADDAVDRLSILAYAQTAILATGKYSHPLSLRCPVAAVMDGSEVCRELEHREGDAALMLALRSRTDWHKEWMRNLPF